MSCGRSISARNCVKMSSIPSVLRSASTAEPTFLVIMMHSCIDLRPLSESMLRCKFPQPLLSAAASSTKTNLCPKYLNIWCAKLRTSDRKQRNGDCCTYFSPFDFTTSTAILLGACWRLMGIRTTLYTAIEFPKASFSSSDSSRK